MLGKKVLGSMDTLHVTASGIGKRSVLLERGAERYSTFRINILESLRPMT